MPSPRPLPASVTDAGFTVREALAAGATRGRLRAKDLATPFRGVRMRADAADDLPTRCRAYARSVNAEHVFSHATAARLWTLPLPARIENSDDLHVLYLDGQRAPRGAGIVGHKSSRSIATVDREGLRITDPIATWILLATMLTHDELVLAGDRLLRWRDPLADADALARAVAALSGERGARRLRSAHADVRPGSASPRESRVRLAIVRAGLPEPELNAAIGTSLGVVHGDLVFPRQRVVLEYDSEHHRLDDRQWALDLHRYNALNAAGWRVIRISKAMSDTDIVAAVRRALHG
ncbi:hypothetical protein ACIQLJ_05150 [Microbacterium sp. NPDC091313]